jgi:hypothetical protein
MAMVGTDSVVLIVTTDPFKLVLLTVSTEKENGRELMVVVLGGYRMPVRGRRKDMTYERFPGTAVRVTFRISDDPLGR